MLKQLRPLSLMLALAAALPAAQATVLTCNFNDLLPAGQTTFPLATKPDNCGLAQTAITFGGNAVVAGNDSEGASGFTGYKESQKNYVRGTSFTITLADGVEVDGLTLDLTKPSGDLGQKVKITVTGSKGTEPVDVFTTGNASGALWVDDVILSLKTDVGLFKVLTFSADQSLAIDNLRLSLSEQPAVVPEPSLFGLTALALAAAGFAGRRRQQRGV